MAASHGMTSAIMNPLHDEDMHAIYGANVLNGTDKHCKFWTNKFREMTAAPSAAAQAAGEVSSNAEIEARRAAREARRAPVPVARKARTCPVARKARTCPVAR